VPTFWCGGFWFVACFFLLWWFVSRGGFLSLLERFFNPSPRSKVDILRICSVRFFQLWIGAWGFLESPAGRSAPGNTGQHQPTPASPSQHQPASANTSQHQPTPASTSQHQPVPASTSQFHPFSPTIPTKNL
jgi:hypothetical protein